MHAERIRELARNPEHVPGIYNTCDRWCEHCPDRSKCLVFAIKQEMAASLGAEEDDFLGVVKESLGLTHDLLIEAMEEEGLDREEVMAEAKPDPIENRSELLRSHPLVRQAEEYAREAGSHLDALSDALGSAAQSVEAKLDLGLLPERGLTVEDLDACRDALETLLHYRYLICAKLYRAVSARADPAAECEHSPQSHKETPDPDGSAAPPDDPADWAAEGFLLDARQSVDVARKAIRRSIDAWLTLRNTLSTNSAGILEMLVRLDQLHREVETAFPETDR